VVARERRHCSYSCCWRQYRRKKRTYSLINSSSIT